MDKHTEDQAEEQDAQYDTDDDTDDTDDADDTDYFDGEEADEEADDNDAEESDTEPEEAPQAKPVAKPKTKAKAKSAAKGKAKSKKTTKKKAKSEAKSEAKRKKGETPEWCKAIDKASRETKLTPIILQEHRGLVRDALSSGSLVLDLILGGGWAPGRVCAPVGPEGGGKSTILFETLCEAMRAQIPKIGRAHV